MEPNLLSSLTEAELKKQQKSQRNNPWITLLLAYRNPRKARGIETLRHAIATLPSPYSSLAALLCFYRLVENGKEEEAIALGRTLKETENPVDRLSIHTMLCFWDKEEPQTQFEICWQKIALHQSPLSSLLNVNPYFYYLFWLGDFPKNESLAFYPRFSQYSYARFWMAFLSYIKRRTDWEKWRRSFSEKPIPARKFLSRQEHELLTLASRNSLTDENDYLQWKMFSGRYPTLKSLSKAERKTVLDRLVFLEAISAEDGILTLLDGGFFLLACSNRAS